MGKEMVVSADRHETRVALIEDDQLVEVFFQRAQEYSLAGSIHKGRVTRVLPGMQSAFVNLGLERDTFLYVSDFFEENEEFADDKPRGSSAVQNATGGAVEASGLDRGGDRTGDRGDRGPDRGGRGGRSGERGGDRGGDRGRRDGRYRSGGPSAGGTVAPVGLDASSGGPVLGGEFIGEADAMSLDNPYGAAPFSIPPMPPNAPIVTTQAANQANLTESQSEEERRRRRRRGRGRSGFPDSKFGAPVTDETEDLTAGEGDGDEEPYVPPTKDLVLLPGESLRKYTQLKAAPREETPAPRGSSRFIEKVPALVSDRHPETVELEEALAEELGPAPGDEVRVIDTGLIDKEATLDEIQELAEAALDGDAEVVEPVRASLHAPVQVAGQFAPESDEDLDGEAGEAFEEGGDEALEEGADPLLPIAGASAHVRSGEQGRFLQQRPAGAPGRRGRRRGRRGRGDRPAGEESAIVPAVVIEGSELPLVAHAPADVEKEMTAGQMPMDPAESQSGEPLIAAERPQGEASASALTGASAGAARAPRGDRPERSGRGDRGGRGRGRGDRGVDRADRPAEARPAEARSTIEARPAESRAAESRPAEGRAEGGRERSADRGSSDRSADRGSSDRGGDRQRPPLPSISDLLKEGQEILVQIAKEPLGQKGARITSHIALPGRYCVYMPTVNHTGVSRKIESDAERHRLKQILVANTEGMPGGFICRTAGEGRTEQDIAQDITYLHNLWVEIKRKADAKPAPALLYHDVEIVERILRDQLTEDFKAIWIDNEEVYEQVLRFVQRLQPNLVNRVKMFTRPVPIFDFFNITAELEKALKPKVWLKSGGFIVINQTEALVAIDINTGKYVGKTNRLEDTIAKTNVEAVKEIVRQIRLRDLGGIIVIDFIDMDERKNRQKVMQALEDAMRVDKAPYKILQFNDFGLVAITRKRVKQSLERTLCMPCPHCEGAGYIKSVHTVIVEIVSEARKMVRALRDNKDVELRVHPDVAKELKSSGNTYIEEIEEILSLPVAVVSDATIHHEKFSLA